MKGIVFTEFLELVENRFGLEMVDTIIKSSKLESKGIYTSIGVYNFSEMIQLLNNLSENTGISVDDLLLVYSEHFFNVLKNNYSDLFARYKTPIDMLASIEKHIHEEVVKIYPNEEPPRFEVIEKTENSLILMYKSSRAMHQFGLGLMYKTFEDFNTIATIQQEIIKEDGTEVKFIIHTNK